MLADMGIADALLATSANSRESVTHVGNSGKGCALRSFLVLEENASVVESQSPNF